MLIKRKDCFNRIINYQIIQPCYPRIRTGGNGNNLSKNGCLLCGSTCMFAKYCIECIEDAYDMFFKSWALAHYMLNENLGRDITYVIVSIWALFPPDGYLDC